MSYIFLVVFGFSSLIALNQGDVDKIYNKYQNKQGVISMSFSKEMLNSIDLDFDWNEQFMVAKGDFERANMMVFSQESSDANRMANVASDFKTLGYKHVEIKENGESEGHLFIEKRGKRIKEAHFVSGGKSEGIVIFFYGDVELTDKK